MKSISGLKPKFENQIQAWKWKTWKWKAEFQDCFKKFSTYMTNPTIDYFIFTNTNNPTSEIQSAPFLFYYLWSPNSGEDYLHQ